MDPSSEKNKSEQHRNPLVPIGMIVMGILFLPMLFYSTGPEGPVKEGDVVFATGKYRVSLIPGNQTAVGEPQPVCILEPREQLVIMTKLANRAEGTLLARILGKTTSEDPFCPPNAQVILMPHQVTLKVDTWGGIRDTFAHFFSTP